MDYILQLVPSSGGVYKTIYEPGTSNIDDLEIHFEVNEPGYCEFTIYPEHVLFDNITLEECYLRLIYGTQNEVLGIYRVTEIKKDIWGRKYVYAVGDMALLGDSVLPPFEPSDVQKTPMFALTQAVSYHNQQQVGKNFNVNIRTSRTKTYTEGFEYIWYFDNVLDWIKDNIVDPYGGFLAVTYTRVNNTDVRTLEWMDESDASYNNLQTITIGMNILEASDSNITTELATNIIPLGIGLEPEEYSTTESYEVGDFCWHMDGTLKNIYKCNVATSGTWNPLHWRYVQYYINGAQKLTIKSIADGSVGDLDKNGFELASLIAGVRYGTRYKSVDFGDISSPETLLEEAVDYMHSQLTSRSITVKALDLNLTAEEFEKFKYLTKIMVTIPEFNINTQFFIAEQTIYPQNPESNTITLGKTINTLTQQMRKKK